MEKAGSGTDTLLYPCLYPEYFFWSSALVFAGISHRIAYLAFLELTTPILVALGRQKYDATTRARELGAIAVWHPSDAITQ